MDVVGRELVIACISLSDAFADCSSVVVFVSQEKSLNEAIVSLSKEFENSIYPSIIIFERGKNCCCESWKLQKYITFGDELYKLRTYVVTKRGRNRRLGDEDGEIFSCHGGSHYVSWWRQTRYGKVDLATIRCKKFLCILLPSNRCSCRQSTEPH